MIPFGPQHVDKSDDAHWNEGVGRTGAEFVKTGFDFLFGRMNVENIHCTSFLELWIVALPPLSSGYRCQHPAARRNRLENPMALGSQSGGQFR